MNLQDTLKKINTRSWDEEDHPRDEKGQFTFGDSMDDYSVGESVNIKVSSFGEGEKWVSGIIGKKMLDGSAKLISVEGKKPSAFVFGFPGIHFKKRSSVNRKETLIQELKLRAAAVNYSAVSVNEKGNLTRAAEDLDNRIVSGYLFVWGSKNMHNEIFLKGCCAKSIQERGPGSTAKYQILFDWMHDPTDPLARYAELVEDDYGLRFKTKPLDDVPNGDRTITQVRSGTINQFSGAFNYVWDKIDYDETQDALVCKEIDLVAGSPVARASECETYAFRSAESDRMLNEQIEEFIESLPKKDRLQARYIFAKQQALIPKEPLEERMKALLKENQPPEKKLNLTWLANQL